MGQLFKIERDTKKIGELVKLLSKNKEDIKEILCIVRMRNGDINLLDSGCTFETMCSGSKMLDFRIGNELAVDNEIFYEEDDDNEEDEEPEEV